MWHLTACKISFSLLFLKLNDLPTLIQRYDKKIISVLIQFKNERLTDILQASRCSWGGVWEGGGDGGITSYIWHSTDVRAE